MLSFPIKTSVLEIEIEQLLKMSIQKINKYTLQKQFSKGFDNHLKVTIPYQSKITDNSD